MTSNDSSCTANNAKISLALAAAVMMAATSLSSCGVDAFAVKPQQHRPLSFGLVETRMASSLSAVDFPPYFADVNEADAATTTATETAKKTESSPSPKKTAAPKKKVGGHGKDGVFSPVVRLTKTLAGEERINKLRAKVISLHAEVIGNFVDTSSSKMGDTVLELLFAVADKNGDKEISRDELQTAMQTLGFSFLKDKQLDGIFARADKDGDGAIDMEEWKISAPKTLRVNLTKLAKKNGSDMGLLA